MTLNWLTSFTHWRYTIVPKNNAKTTKTADSAAISSTALSDTTKEITAMTQPTTETTVATRTTYTAIRNDVANPDAARKLMISLNDQPAATIASLIATLPAFEQQELLKAYNSGLMQRFQTLNGVYRVIYGIRDSGMVMVVETEADETINTDPTIYHSVGHLFAFDQKHIAIHPQAGKYIGMALRYTQANRMSIVDCSKTGDIITFVIKENMSKGMYNVTFKTTENGVIYFAPKWVNETIETVRPGQEPIIRIAPNGLGGLVNIDKWVHGVSEPMKKTDIVTPGQPTRVAVSGSTLKYVHKQMVKLGGEFDPELGKHGAMIFDLPLPAEVVQMIEKSEVNAERTSNLPTTLHAVAFLLAEEKRAEALRESKTAGHTEEQYARMGKVLNFYSEIVEALRFNFDSTEIEALISKLNYGARTAEGEKALPKSVRTPQAPKTYQPTRTGDFRNPQQALGFATSKPQVGFGRGKNTKR